MLCVYIYTILYITQGVSHVFIHSFFFLLFVFSSIKNDFPFLFLFFCLYFLLLFPWWNVATTEMFFEKLYQCWNLFCKDIQVLELCIRIMFERTMVLKRFSVSSTSRYLVSNELVFNVLLLNLRYGTYISITSTFLG